MHILILLEIKPSITLTVQKHSKSFQFKFIANPSSPWNANSTFPEKYYFVILHIIYEKAFSVKSTLTENQ